MAGAVLGINPFDQPNVQESKDATNRLLKNVQERGSLTEPAPVMTHGPLSFFTKDGADSPEQLLWSFLSQARSGDYVSLQAYLTEEAETQSLLEAIRLTSGIRSSSPLPSDTVHGFFTLRASSIKEASMRDSLSSLRVGTRSISPSPANRTLSGSSRKAQALGDLEALNKHGRRVMRIDLGDDREEGARALAKACCGSPLWGAGAPCALRRPFFAFLKARNGFAPFDRLRIGGSGQMEGGTYEMAMVGLGVMGRNLALNMADKGFAVVGYDVDPQKVEALNREAKGRSARGAGSVEELAAACAPAAGRMMMVPAGASGGRGYRRSSSSFEAS